MQTIVSCFSMNSTPLPFKTLFYFSFMGKYIHTVKNNDKNNVSCLTILRNIAKALD